MIYCNLIRITITVCKIPQKDDLLSNLVSQFNDSMHKHRTLVCVSIYLNVLCVHEYIHVMENVKYL